MGKEASAGPVSNVWRAVVTSSVLEPARGWLKTANSSSFIKCDKPVTKPSVARHHPQNLANATK